MWAIPMSHGAPRMPRSLRDGQKRGRVRFTAFTVQYYSCRTAVILPSLNFPIHRCITEASPTFFKHVQFFPRPLCDCRRSVMNTSYSFHGGRTTVTEVVRPSPTFIHASVVGASRIVHQCIREAPDGSKNSPRHLRVGSTTYATDTLSRDVH